MEKSKFEIFRSYLMISLGLFMHAFAWIAFLVPAKIVGGGVAGIGTLIYFSTGIPIGISVLLINIVLLLLGLRILGASIGINTIYGISLVSFFLWILQILIKDPLVNDPFMSTLIGGALSGAGLGIAFANGGNSGGTDIIALIVTKYKNISIGRVILYLDLIIISSSFIIFKSIETMIYGFVTMAVMAYAIDLVIDGAKQSYQLMIFSEKNNEIANRLSEEVGRGATTLHGHGFFKKQKNVLLVIIRKQEKNKVFRIINQTDPVAFISIAKVSGVFGKNFDDIKI